MTQTLAIVERLPGHTEVMGGFAALALELGLDVHLLFNHGDKFHMVEYLGTRLAIGADRIHEWSYINDHDFDVILLNTSCVWLDYGFQLRQWNSNRRLIVVHHLPQDIKLNPHGASLYLTPAVDKEKWIFPLYGKPTAAEFVLQKVPGRNDGPELPTLITIGALDLKDIGDVSAYLKAGGRVVHYDRHRCSFFLDQNLYTQHVGLSGTEFMSSLAEQNQPILLWFPIVPESLYMIYRFTGALIMGVDLKCIMVMPERFRQLYGFPKEAVISYDSSVMEAECVRKLRESPREQLERWKRLGMWATERWDKNMEIFRGMVRPQSG